MHFQSTIPSSACPYAMFSNTLLLNPYSTIHYFYQPVNNCYNSGGQMFFCCAKRSTWYVRKGHIRESGVGMHWQHFGPTCDRLGVLSLRCFFLGRHKAPGQVKRVDNICDNRPQASVSGDVGLVSSKGWSIEVALITDTHAKCRFHRCTGIQGFCQMCKCSWI